MNAVSWKVRFKKWLEKHYPAIFLMSEAMTGLILLAIATGMLYGLWYGVATAGLIFCIYAIYGDYMMRPK